MPNTTSATPAVGNIRTLALVGPAAAGKTTLAEALLQHTGAIGAAGRVERGSTVSDHDALEIKAGHSLQSSVMHLDHDGCRIHLIDTPGAPDFIGQSLPALEAVETAAVVTRVAPSFVRFGHFEHFAANDQEEQLRTLADYVIDRYYPECRSPEATSPWGGNPYAALLHSVSERTAQLMAQWQTVGFCHGVMNTDNMSILGLTLDYGPFQFLDAFVPGHICNHSDHHGRYAYNRQPNIAYWNLFCLAQALLPLIEDQDTALAALESYKTVFPDAFMAQMHKKLGLTQAQDSSEALVEPLLQLLAQNAVDYTIFWRRLSHAVAQGQFEPVCDLFADRAAFDAWLLSYSELLALEDKALAADLMLNSNPKFVLRNHLGEQAIRAAKGGDFSELATLQRLLERPFDEHPGHEAYADFPPDWASSISISCSS